jgi:hypothetical protein
VQHKILQPGRRGRAVLALCLVLLIAQVSACGGSKHPKKSTPTPSSTAGTPTTTAPDSAEAAKVRQVYTRFVDPAVPVSQKVALIQGGAVFLPAMQAASTSQYAKTVTIKITSITVNSANRATVVFNVLLSGSPVVTNQKGYAVQEGGQWKVAGITFCGLLAAQGPLPAACKSPAATSLPR